MAVDVSFKLEGIDDLVKNLENVSLDMKQKTGRSALRKAAAVIVAAARANVEKYNDPSTQEDIGKNVYAQFNNRLLKSTGDLGMRVGIRGGAKYKKGYDAFKTGGRKGNPGGDTWYWRFLEFGTKSFAAKPFLRPALENNVEKATKVFLDTYQAGLTKAIKKASQ